MKTVDIAIIGGGSAGYAAARTAVSEGLDTLVIEGGKDVGGLCILRGCMPSKALIESANRFRTLKRAKEFGLRAQSISVEPQEILARKARLIGEFADYRREQLQDGRFQFIRGTASFVNQDQLEVRHFDGETEHIQAKAFVLATGSVVQIPKLPGLENVDFITSDEALDLGELPGSMIVLGAGPVALEMAHYFSTIGVVVTVIQRSDQVLKGVDSDVAKVVEDAFRERGVKVFTNTQISSITQDPESGRKWVTFSHAGAEVSIEADTILNALGRSPNVTGLNLERAGVEVAKGRIVTSRAMQTSMTNIFAAGDVCGPYEVVHEAIAQGETAARNIARLLGRRKDVQFDEMDYRLKLFAVFTDPEVGVVGMSEDEAAKQGIAVVAAKYPFADHGKSLVMGETHGFVKLIMDLESGEICGGAVVGPHASELIHEVVVAMAFRSTPAQFAKIPHYHPTLSEIWSYPAEELAERSI
jgi:pyruvate/2-oxoglutarate dehydrogenase complex dihydrolipoamide dehydrogenase (E3) component